MCLLLAHFGIEGRNDADDSDRSFCVGDIHEREIIFGNLHIRQHIADLDSFAFKVQW